VTMYLCLFTGQYILINVKKSGSVLDLRDHDTTEYQPRYN